MLVRRLQRVRLAQSSHFHSIDRPASKSVLITSRTLATSSSKIGRRGESDNRSNSSIRSLHASSRSAFIPFFGLNKKTEDPEHIAHAFLDALEAKDPEKITQTYTALNKYLRSDPELDASTLISTETITSAIILLSQTSYINDDFATLRQMFEDLRRLWHLEEQSDEDHSAYLKALILSGRISTAEKHLQKTIEGRSKWSPAAIDWCHFLEGYSAIQQKELRYNEAKRWLIHNVPEDKRSVKIYITLLKSLTTLPRDIRIDNEIDWLLESIRQKERTPRDELEVQSTLLSGYLDRNDTENSHSTMTKLRDLVGSENGSALPPVAVITMARYELSHGDPARAKRLFQDLASTSDLPKALATITEDVVRESGAKVTLSLAELQDSLARVEHHTGLLPSYKAYEIATWKAEDFISAVQLYRDAYRDGVPVSSGMLRAIVSKAKGPHQADSTDTLKSIYADLARSSLTESRSHDGLHNTAMYIRLLQYCARSDVRDLAWATSLMEDMKANGLSLLNSALVTRTESSQVSQDELSITASTSACSIVTSLMQNACDDHSQAFKAYSWMWAIDQQNIFSRKDWYTIVRTYSDLTFGDGTKQSYVPASIYYAFFEDMRKVGHPPDSAIYQSVLHYYAREGTSQKSNAEAVSHIHDLIKMDHYYDPDIGLMNRLMYAYGKTGDLDHALSVWRSILINRIPFNNVSISIILDVYGYKGAYDKLTKLWLNLSKQGFVVNKKNFESYIEASCRCGHLSEATEEVFKALHKQQDGIAGADSLSLLLQFSRTDSKFYYALRERIEREVPQLWNEVKSIGQKYEIQFSPDDDLPKEEPRLSQTLLRSKVAIGEGSEFARTSGEEPLLGKP